MPSQERVSSWKQWFKLLQMLLRNQVNNTQAGNQPPPLGAGRTGAFKVFDKSSSEEWGLSAEVEARQPEVDE